MLYYRVPVPTERRVKRWGFCMEELLADLMGRHEFEIYLEKEFSAENIHFWLAVQKLKTLQLSKVGAKVNEIYRSVEITIEFTSAYN